MSDDPFTAGARAAEEIAKASGKAIDASTSFGRFLSRVFGPALEEWGGSLHDQARYWRRSRLLAFTEKYEKACNEIGERMPTPVDPKFALALLDAASFENNDDLQDMFARLLANATTEGTGIEARRAFVSILQDLNPLDVRLLLMINNAPTEGPTKTIDTANFPEAYYTLGPHNPPLMPPGDVEISLWNLARVSCIEPTGTEGGGSTMSTVTLTALGRALVEACTTGLPKKSEERDIYR